MHGLFTALTAHTDELHITHCNEGLALSSSCKSYTSPCDGIATVRLRAAAHICMYSAS